MSGEDGRGPAAQAKASKADDDETGDKTDQEIEGEAAGAAGENARCAVGPAEERLGAAAKGTAVGEKEFTAEGRTRDRAADGIGGEGEVGGRAAMVVDVGAEKFLPVVTTKKALAHLATVMPDGTPQVTPVWFLYEGASGKFIVNTARGRVKDRNMSQNAHVALSIVDPDNPFAHLAVRGTIASVTEEGADANIDVLAQKYLGTPYPFRRPGEVRVMYEIEPISIASMG